MNGTKYAYSALPSILLKRRISVAELYQRLKSGGRHFDRKSVYRLASHEPFQTLNMPLVGAVCDELAVDLQHLISLAPPPPKLERLDAAMQDRLDELMSRNNEGKLTGSERRELGKMVDEVERISLTNARLMARQAGRAKRPAGPAAARKKQRA